MSEIPRQIFRQNGEPIEGQSASSDEALSRGLLVGIARVWLWRHYEGGQEVLVQKRANKPLLPDKYDLAAGGHIDEGEIPIEAAAREVYEELGIKINPEELCLSSMFRLSKDIDEQKVRNLVWTYLYQLNGDEEVTVETKEVESAQWLSLDKCLELAEAGRVSVPATVIRPTIEAIKDQSLRN